MDGLPDPGYHFSQKCSAFPAAAATTIRRMQGMRCSLWASKEPTLAHSAAHPMQSGGVQADGGAWWEAYLQGLAQRGDFAAQALGVARRGRPLVVELAHLRRSQPQIRPRHSHVQTRWPQEQLAHASPYW